jgi:ABC-type methionine transport system permease subunit
MGIANTAIHPVHHVLELQHLNAFHVLPYIILILPLMNVSHVMLHAKLVTDL